MLYSASVASKVSLALAQRVPGLELRVVYFRSPFFLDPEETAVSSPPGRVRLSTKNLKKEFLGIFSRDGGLPFPCGACRRVILSRAARLLRRAKLDFVITGDLLGKGGLWEGELERLDREVGLAGRVVRPLSGRLLPVPEPVRRGWWPGDYLFGLTSGDAGELGSLARRLGVRDGLEAAERCLLTDPVYLGRLRTVSEEGLPTANTLQLLSFRNFIHIPPDLKVVVALDGAERVKLQGLFLPEDMRIYFSSPNSPLILARADWRRYGPEGRLVALAAVLREVETLLDRPLESLGELCYRLEREEETARVAPPFIRTYGGLKTVAAEVYSKA